MNPPHDKGLLLWKEAQCENYEWNSFQEWIIQYYVAILCIEMEHEALHVVI